MLLANGGVQKISDRSVFSETYPSPDDTDYADARSMTGRWTECCSWRMPGSGAPGGQRSDGRGVALTGHTGETQSAFVQNLGHFTGIGESSCLSLGINQVPIDENIEYTTASRDQLCFHTGGLPQLFRQTDGLGEVALKSEPSCSWQQGHARGSVVLVTIPASSSPISSAEALALVRRAQDTAGQSRCVPHENQSCLLGYQRQKDPGCVP